MELSALAGNPRLKELLSRQEEGRGLSHAYILSGSPGSGRHTLARLLTQALVCTAQPGQRPCGTCSQCKKVRAEIHPDREVIAGLEPGKPINVDQIRNLQKQVHIRPNEGERKVYWLEEADRMNDSAQNAMLKLLEDGPKYACFLLITENAGAMLQTIRSRCVELPLAPISPRECEQWLIARYPDRDRELLRQTALDCQGLLGRGVQMLEQAEQAVYGTLVQDMANAIEQGNELALLECILPLEKVGREDIKVVLDGLERELTGRMIQSRNRQQLLKGTDLIRQLRLAAAVNVNSGQLFGWLCAGIFSEDR